MKGRQMEYRKRGGMGSKEVIVVSKGRAVQDCEDEEYEFNLEDWEGDRVIGGQKSS